jgi:hypothetical protein
MGEGVVIVSELLDAALGYAARDAAVFPCEVGGKRPLGRLAPHGLKDATTDADQIRAWWSDEPDANIGLPTGIHFDVLDIDGPEALEALELAGPLGAPDIEGPIVMTPRGWHCYLAPTGRGNTVNLGGLSGCDWRGKGGYVVAPPSVKADGTAWEWLTGTPQDQGPDTPIVPAPVWLVALFDRQHGSPIPAGTESLPRHAGRTGYGAAALERELGRLVTAPVGTRNHQLNKSAHALGQLVGTGALDPEETGQGLLRVAMTIGLGETEATATIRSGLSAGIRTPRRKVP